MKPDRDQPLGVAPWRPPTRRAFVAMLAAAALALRARTPPAAPKRPVWIGHA